MFAVPKKILQYLDKIDERSGRITKMDFLRIAGNERLSNEWIEYLLRCNLIIRIRENNREFYAKTDVGQKIHDALKLHPYVGTLFEDFGRDRRHALTKS